MSPGFLLAPFPTSFLGLQFGSKVLHGWTRFGMKRGDPQAVLESS